jgi:N6-adenosine-specific RNA methylase IME4
MDALALIRHLVPMFAKIMAKDSAACWWVYDPRLPESLMIGQELGFTYKGRLLEWTKTTKDGRPHIGLGKTTWKVCESAWLLTRGRGLPIRDHVVCQLISTEEDLPNVIEAPRRQHSQKPDEAYQALERLYGDVRRLDMYARTRRLGWTAWGNDVEDEAPI